VLWNEIRFIFLKITATAMGIMLLCCFTQCDERHLLPNFGKTEDGRSNSKVTNNRDDHELWKF
jgi:hypothetical protein